MAYAKQGQEGKTRLERFQDGVRALGHFLYHRNEEGEITVMGRNGKSWAKISVFFLIFYGCLAGFFAAMLSIFLTTIPERADGPKMKGFLEGKPGLIPLPTEVKSGDYGDYVKAINDFLKPYKSASLDEYQNCTEDERERGSKPCIMDLTALGECYSNEEKFQYGYDDGKPCIFFKMNKVYGWTPEANEGKDYVELACHFKDGKNNDKLHELPSDKPGFLVNFYPYFSEKNWLSPIAALKVNTTDPGIVQCEALAKNIKLTDTYRLDRGAIGKTRIEIKQ